MKRVVGSPGTWSGMALRLSQCVFASASTFAMVSGFGYSNYSAFFYLNLSLILQLLWSMFLACKDIFALRNKEDLHTQDNIFFIVMIDFGRSWRGLGCGLAKLKGNLQKWTVLCDAAQVEVLRRFALLLDKHRGELLRIAWRDE